MGVLTNCIIIGLALELDDMSWTRRLALAAIPLVLINSMFALIVVNGVMSWIRASRQEFNGDQSVCSIGKEGQTHQQHIKDTVSQKIVGTALLVPVVGIGMWAGYLVLGPSFSSYNWLLNGAARAGAVIVVIAMVVFGYALMRGWYE